MRVELNGIAHIQLSVNNPHPCVPFWEKLCHFMGMKTLIKGEDVVYPHGGPPRQGRLKRCVYSHQLPTRSPSSKPASVTSSLRTGVRT